jgi:2-methylisocitrate lyase-like PEP mutase family enzyme
LFPEALASEDDMSVCCTKFETPVMVNMANTGSAPVPGAAVLAEIGFAFSIYPSLTSLVAAKAMEAALMDLRENGNGEPSELFSFREFGTLIGFDEVHAFERKFARE